jgi:putative transposase
MFLRLLEVTREQYGLLIIGYVVMPEHVHLLVSEPERRNLSVALKALKQAVARRVLRSWRRRTEFGRLFEADLPPHFWQARFYDFNVFTAKKRIEKLRYIHRNPVKRKLVESPEQWRWSSYRYYAFGEEGPVKLNLMLPNAWKKAKQT